MIKNNLSLFILFLALSQIIFSNDEELKKFIEVDKELYKKIHNKRGGKRTWKGI